MDAAFSPDAAHLPHVPHAQDSLSLAAAPGAAPVGWLEVICGPMFSGKTEELIRRLRRATLARLDVAVFKPHIDQRYHRTDIVSHSQQSLVAQPVARASQILERLGEGGRVVGIDEAQFFDAQLVAVVQHLASTGRRVVIAGLDQDFTGAPFEPIPQLLAVAEYVTKTLAICMACGAPAGRTQRLGPQRGQVLVGAQGAYEARCRRCHDAPGTVAASVRP